MDSRYPATIHVDQRMVNLIDQPIDGAVISSRPGGGNTTQSYVKGDIVADQLNKIFGPLGWSKASRIHDKDDWTETKSVTRNNQRVDVEMHMVQVISDVTLTIKKITPDGTDTVFVEQGIGYGEVEAGKSRKEAFGMAVKGASTDGLKRCASLLGKAFGMMMASNGSQDDLEYAHNGRAQNLNKARQLRREAGGSGRPMLEDQRGGRGHDRDEAPRQLRDERGNGAAPAREEHSQRDDRGPRQDRGEQTSRGRQDDRQEGARDSGSGQRAAARQADERSDDKRRSEGEAAPSGANAKGQGDRDQQADRRPAVERDAGGRGDRTAEDRATGRDQQKAATTDAAGKAADAPSEAAKRPTRQGARRQPDTNYPLDSLPITKDDMTDFGATLVERVREMRQNGDRVSLVKQHLNTVKNLDTAIRRRVIEVLRELDVDVDKIPS